MLPRRAIALLIVVPLLSAGCLIQVPPDERADDGGPRWFSQTSTRSWTEDVEVARVPFHLGATTGFSHDLDVDIPANATGLKVQIERSGTIVNFAYEGLGKCDRRTSGSVNIMGGGTTSQGCDAPSSGVRAVTASMDGGEASFVFVVTAHVRHVEAR